MLMKRLRSSLYFCTVLLILLAACAPQSTPVVTAAPVTQAPATATATLVPVPTVATAPVTLVPVTLVGPPMKVGSMWPYVDGTILVAVPRGPFPMGPRRPGYSGPVDIPPDFLDSARASQHHQ